MTGNVVLVGAGCGKKKWITLEGLECLRDCDVVVYDDLIDPALLDEVAEGAERIPVGKRCGRLSAKQEDINQTLIDLALAGKRVVRLKGGDPFIFGRGGEEIEGLNRNSIPWRVVPGISSAVAVPGEAGIPVTHRGIARSLHIITAHTKEDTLPENLEALAKTDGTLVFLMGLSSLEPIAQALIGFGKAESTPAAVISGGNSPHPTCVIGTLSDIAEKVRAAKVCPPAVIVVGDVVGLDLKGAANGVKRVGLTGTDDFRRKVEAELAFSKMRTVSLMEGKCTPVANPIPWAALNENWTVFTSIQGVRAFFDRADRENVDRRSFAGTRFAVIGDATRAELKRYGYIADLSPELFTSEALAEKLESVDGEIFMLCSAKASRTVEARIGARVHRVEIYDTEYIVKRTEDLPEIIVFGSAGGVNALRDAGIVIPAETKCVCIGPVSAKAVQDWTGRTPIMTKDISARSIAEAVCGVE